MIQFRKFPGQSSEGVNMFTLSHAARRSALSVKFTDERLVTAFVCLVHTVYSIPAQHWRESGKNSIGMHRVNTVHCHRSNSCESNVIKTLPVKPGEPNESSAMIFTLRNALLCLTIRQIVFEQIECCQIVIRSSYG